MISKASLFLLLFLLILSTLLLPVFVLKDKDEGRTKSIEKQDILGNIIDASGLSYNNSSLKIVSYRTSIKDNIFSVEYDEPVAYAFLFIKPDVLDRNPEYFLVKFRILGVSNFIYGVRVIKVLDSTSSPDFETGPTVLFKYKSEESFHLMRIDTYPLNGFLRKNVPRNDLLQFFTSNLRQEQTNENLILKVEILQLYAIYSDDSLAAAGATNLPIPLTLYILIFILLVFVLPTVLIILINNKHTYHWKKILVIGFFIRLIIAPFTAHAYDIDLWKYATRMFYEKGEIALFSNWTPPPLFYFILIFFYAPYALLRYFFGFQDVRFFYLPVRALEATFIKLPMILADAVIFIIIIKIIQKLDIIEERDAVLFSTFYFLSPLTIFISAVWAGYDSIAIVFALLGILLLTNKKFLEGGIAFSMSFLAKWIGVAPFIFSVLYLAFSRRWKESIKIIAGMITGIFIVYIMPFIITDQIQILAEVLLYRAGKGANVITWFGLSYLQYLKVSDLIYLIPEWYIDNHFLIFGSIFFLVILLYMRKKVNELSLERILIEATLLSFLAFFVSYPESHEPHVLWILPFIILYSAATRKTIKHTQDISIALPSISLMALISAFSGQTLSYMLLGFPDPNMAMSPNDYVLQGVASLIFSFWVILGFLVLTGLNLKYTNFFIKGHLKLIIKGRNASLFLMLGCSLLSLFATYVLAYLIFYPNPKISIFLGILFLILLPIYLSSVLGKMQYNNGEIIISIL